MSADILTFPKPHIRPELLLTQAAELKEKGEKYAKEQLFERANMITDTLMLELADSLDEEEIPTTDESVEKDFALVWYALQATIFRYFGFDHDLHEYMNAAVKNDETGTWDHHIFKVKNLINEKKPEEQTANIGNTKIAATSGKE